MSSFQSRPGTELIAKPSERPAKLYRGPGIILYVLLCLLLWISAVPLLAQSSTPSGLSSSLDKDLPHNADMQQNAYLSLSDHSTKFAFFMATVGFAFGLTAMAFIWQINRTKVGKSPKYLLIRDRAQADFSPDAHCECDKKMSCLMDALNKMEFSMFDLNQSVRAIEGRIDQAGSSHRLMEEQVKGLRIVLQSLKRQIAGTDSGRDLNIEQEPEEPASGQVDNAVATEQADDIYSQAKAAWQEAENLKKNNQFREAEGKLRLAITSLGDLLTLAPENQTWLRDMVMMLHSAGRLLEELKQPKVALSHMRTALHLAEKTASCNPEDLSWQRGLANSHSHVGRIMLTSGMQQEAFEHFRKDLEIIDRLAAAQPDNRSLQMALAISQSNMTQAHEALGNYDAAIDGYNRQLPIMEKLLKQEPDNSDLRLDIAYLHGHLARLMKEKGNFNQSLEEAWSYLEIMEELNSRSPDNLQWLKDLASAQSMVGRLLELTEDYDSAFCCFEKCLEARKGMVANDPGSPHRKNDMAIAIYKLGDASYAKGDWPDALSYYEEALEVLENLNSGTFEEGPWLFEKCCVLMRIGKLHARCDSNSAAKYYHKALTIANPQAAGAAAAQGWIELAAKIKKYLTELNSGEGTDGNKTSIYNTERTRPSADA